MNIYCLTQFLSPKSARGLAGEEASGSRVSCVAAIRLGLQLLKGSTVLENPFPGSLPCCWVTQHFTVSPPKSCSQNGNSSPQRNDSKEREPRPNHSSLQPSLEGTCPVTSTTCYRSHRVSLSQWERTIQGCEPQDGRLISAMWRVGSHAIQQNQHSSTL